MRLTLWRKVLTSRAVSYEARPRVFMKVTLEDDGRLI